MGKWQMGSTSISKNVFYFYFCDFQSGFILLTDWRTESLHENYSFTLQSD